jgi:lipopolysaccharide transport system permease protein
LEYRDLRYIIPLAIQFKLYGSPVGFSSAVVPEGWRFWYSLNPVVGVIDGFRWCVLGGDSRLYIPGSSSASSSPSSSGSASPIFGAPNAASPT